MSNSPTPTRGPWRLLILDRSDAGDAKWILCTVVAPGDVRPASPGANCPDELVAAWAAGHGKLTPVRAAAVWTVDR